jgi:hypothetical protein
MRRVSALVLLFAASLYAQNRVTDKPLVTVSLADYQKLTATPPPTTVVIDTIEYDEMSRATGAAYIHTSSSKEGVTQEVYQGLPARFQLPSGERFTSFGTELLRVDRPQQVAVVMLSAGLLWWLHAAFLAVAAVLIWRHRLLLTAALNARFAAPEVRPV